MTTKAPACCQMHANEIFTHCNSCSPKLKYAVVASRFSKQTSRVIKRNNIQDDDSGGGTVITYKENQLKKDFAAVKLGNCKKSLSKSSSQ